MSKRQRLPVIGRAVVVRWHDIATQQGWTDTAGKLGPAQCVSIGFLVSVVEKDGRKALTLAGMHGTSDGDPNDHEANCRQSIPAGCITSWAYVVEDAAPLSVRVSPPGKEPSP